MVNGCSEGVLLLATFGGIFLYLVVGALVAALLREILKDCDEESFLLVISFIFWPVALVALVLYIVGMWILTPLWAATKVDLRETESRLSDRIDIRCTPAIRYSPDGYDLDIFEYEDAKNPFKEGDIVTGIVPQTDKNGNKISYNHLYQGCRCRVLSTNGSNSMKVILIGHKDLEAHRRQIGKTFNVPTRNFTVVRVHSKKVASTSSSRRKSSNRTIRRR